MLMAGCLSLVMNTACFKQLEMEEVTPPIQLEVEQNMAGKWYVFSRDAQPVPTNEKHVVTYEAGWKSYRSQSHEGLSQNWMSKSGFSCTVYGSEITEKAGSLEYKSSVITISPTEMQADVVEKDGAQSTSHRFVFRKDDADYSQGVVGLWEGKFDKAGLPTADDHRWEFRADGTYVYYNRDTVNDVWVANPDLSADYLVDGKWLAMRRVDPSQGEIRECWDISIERERMYWIALREDSVKGRYNEQKELSKVK